MNISNNHKRKGIAVVWMAITIIMVVGIMALMLEGGRIYFTSHHLQNCADAAALVGARYVAVLGDPNYPDAREQAVEYALLNHTLGGQIDLATNDDNSQDRDIVIGRWITQADPPYFIPTLDTPNAMKVVARLDDDLNPSLPMRLGTIFGGQPNKLSRWAIAVAYNSYGAGVIACAPDGRGLYVHGNITVDVTGGAIQVNSGDPDTAIRFGGSSLQVLSEQINVHGGVLETGFDASEDIFYHDIQGTLQTGAPRVPCPYSTIPEPPVDKLNDLSPQDAEGNPMPIRVSNGEELTLYPGYYSQGIEMTGGVVNMQDGIYNLGGDMTDNKPNGGLNMTGGTLNATNTLLHIIDNGELYVGGNATINLTPYTYEGHPFSIWQSRDMNSNGTLDSEEDLDPLDFKATIIGTTGSTLEGILYFPEHMLYTEGGGASMGTQLVAYRIEIGGSGVIKINYNGSPEPADNSYLVE